MTNARPRGALQSISTAILTVLLIVIGFPLEVHAQTSTNAVFRNVVIDSGHAYAAAGDAGMLVFELGDPAAPRVVAQYWPGYPVYSVLAVGASRAYLLDAQARLIVVDVADPAHPRTLGLLQPIGSGGVHQAVLAGGYLYVGFVETMVGQSGVKTFDVSDPTRPREVGFYRTDLRPVHGVTLAGGYLYAAVAGTLEAIDVSIPTSLRRVGALAGAGLGPLASDGRYVYAAGWTGSAPTLGVVDPSDPGCPGRIEGNTASTRGPAPVA